MKLVSRSTAGYGDLTVVLDVTPRLLELIEMSRRVFASEFSNTQEFNCIRFHLPCVEVFDCVVDGEGLWGRLEETLEGGFEPMWSTINVGHNSITFDIVIGEDDFWDTPPLYFEDLYDMMEECK